MIRSTSTSNPPSRAGQPQPARSFSDAASQSRSGQHTPARPAIPVLMHWAELRFPAHPRHLGDARRRLRILLGGAPITEDVVLCASEVAANAVMQSGSRNAGEYCTIHAELYEDGHVRIEVEDECRPWTALLKDRGYTWARLSSADGQAHLGLLIVRQLARSWGVQCHGEMARIVWFEVAPSFAWA